MRFFLWNIVLALTWAALMVDLSLETLLIGFCIGFGVLFLLRSLLRGSNFFRDVSKVVGLGVYFVVELFLSNLKMAYYTVMPLNRMRPGVIAVPLETMSDTEMTLLANLITLTPGTLSLDCLVDPDTGQRTLYVHVMSFETAEQFRREIKQGFERKVLEAMR